jgi:uncharacterized membrane protein YkvA (DUF1232 family)
LASYLHDPILSPEVEIMATWNMASVKHFEEHEQTVRRDFWTALKQFAGRLPFVEDLVAAYYCALDPATPMRVRGILLAALVYLIFRWRYRPLAWLWRGLAFSDDAAVRKEQDEGWLQRRCKVHPQSKRVKRYSKP